VDKGTKREKQQGKCVNLLSTSRPETHHALNELIIDSRQRQPIFSTPKRPGRVRDSPDCYLVDAGAHSRPGNRPGREDEY